MMHQLLNFVALAKVWPELIRCRSIAELATAMCRAHVHKLFPLFCQILIVLTLPVSTATGERTFSATKILKKRIRSKMGENYCRRLMDLYVNKRCAAAFNTDEVLHVFMSMTNRRTCIWEIIDAVQTSEYPRRKQNPTAVQQPLLPI